MLMVAEGPPGGSSAAPRLFREGYLTIPSRERLMLMTDAELSAVSGFSIAREGVGRIVWEGETSSHR